MFTGMTLAHVSPVFPEDHGPEAEVAPPPEPPRPHFQEEVVVTAQKREQKLATVPISIQALGDVELRTLGATTVMENSLARRPNNSI